MCQKVQFFLYMIGLSVRRSVFYVLSTANGAVQNSRKRNEDKSVLKRRVRSGSKGGPGAKREGGSRHVANGELHFTVVGLLKQKYHLVYINRTIIDRACLKTKSMQNYTHRQHYLIQDFQALNPHTRSCFHTNVGVCSDMKNCRGMQIITQRGHLTGNDYSEEKCIKYVQMSAVVRICIDNIL